MQDDPLFSPLLCRLTIILPAVSGDEEEVDDDDGWDVGSYADEGLSLAEEAALAEQEHRRGGDDDSNKIS